MAEHYVYLYRAAGGAPKYVGYGHHLTRALSHAEHSHNERLREWLTHGRFDLTVAGPYRDEAEAKAVEAALISALGPEYNVAPGDGPRFVPVGVPPALAGRTALAALEEHELGVLTRGALVVYLAPGDFLSDGRRKYDAADPRDTDVLSNMRGYWDLAKHASEWAAHPDLGPQVLIGVHGRNVAHRFIVGAAAIDTSRWGDQALYLPERRRWQVPLLEPINLDVGGLRGRRVAGLRFGQFSWQLHKWIDQEGRVRHPVPRRDQE